MSTLKAQDPVALYMQEIKFAKEEIARRKASPVLVRAEDIAAEFKGYHRTLIVDPRVGFNVKAFRFWINKLPPGGEEGAKWKTIGHRHTVEAVIYIVQGEGYSVIDGVKYPWTAGDFICVPMFAWHRHVNTSKGDMIYVASTTGPLSMALGVAIYEDERYPDQWVFAQGGEESQKSLIPGENGKVALDSKKHAFKKGGYKGASAELYEQQIRFSAKEEKRRRAGKVFVEGKYLRFTRTPMGRVAYVIDPRLGFYVRVMSTLMAEIPAGKRSGCHRHLYEEINYVMSGSGYSIIDDRRYDWKAGDAMSIPVFGWHQHFNTGSEPVRFLVHTTRPCMENFGHMVVQQGEVANF
jgi:mannose-6-phosphate isomerase-like protein (cupin superfamily)